MSQVDGFVCRLAYGLFLCNQIFGPLFFREVFRRNHFFDEHTNANRCYGADEAVDGSGGFIGKYFYGLYHIREAVAETFECQPQAQVEVDTLI